jgi:hypothetical protein
MCYCYETNGITAELSKDKHSFDVERTIPVLNHVHFSYSVFHAVKTYRHKFRTHYIYTFTDKLRYIWQNNYLRFGHIFMYQ